MLIARKCMNATNVPIPTQILITYMPINEDIVTKKHFYVQNAEKDLNGYSKESNI